MVRCFECMEEYEETYSKCPYCGEERRWIQQGKEYLNPGTKPCLGTDRGTEGY